MKLSLEKGFAIFSLLFFTGTLNFNSLFMASEGIETTQAIEAYNPLLPLLSLTQHGIFLVSAILLIARWKISIRTVLRNKFIFILVFLFLLSCLWSVYPDLTLRRSLALAETTIFATYLASRFTLKEQFKLLTWTLGISMVINIMLTLGLPSSAIESGKHVGAWRGAIENKNYFGRLMALCTLVFGIAEPESRRHNALLKVGFCLSLVLLILSSSKTALVSIVYLWLVLLPIYKSTQWNFRIATVFQSIFFLIMGCGLVLIASNLDSIATVFGRDLTLTGRTGIWLAVFTKLQEQPLLGYGYYGFWNRLDGPSRDVIEAVGNNYIVPHSHNGFLELALATGILGVATFAISFLLVCRKSITQIYLGKEHTRNFWPVLYLSFLMIYNLTENTLVSHNSVFWVIYVSLALSNFSSYPGKCYQKRDENAPLTSYYAK
ncbi:MAG: O-antigen ligase family protein [Nodosilinea sp.]